MTDTSRLVAPELRMINATIGSENKNNSPNTAPPIRQILNFVALQYKIPYAEMVSGNRTERVSSPRHVGMYLASRLTGKSSALIGRVFNRDNSTVRQACVKMAGLINSSPELASEIQTLELTIRRDVLALAPPAPDDVLI
jgi:chromosomal replication initiation ATPase DnaA